MAFADDVATADRAALAVFGEVVTYLPAPAQPPGPPGVGEPSHPVGIFDERFVLDKGTANAGVEATAPAVFLLLADLPVDPEDDDPTLTIRGRDYRVIERMPDGLGGIVLVLRLKT